MSVSEKRKISVNAHREQPGTAAEGSQQESAPEHMPWQTWAPLAETLSAHFLPKGLLVGGNFEDSSQERAGGALGNDIAGR